MTITYLTSLITIVMVPFGWMVWEYKCWDIGWNYNLWTKVISLCEWVEWDTEFYKNHEISHYLYFNLLSNSQKEQYHKEYEKAKKQGIWSFYRQYAMDSEIEDFADNGSLLFTKKNSNPSVMRRVRLIKKFMGEISI